MLALFTRSDWVTGHVFLDNMPEDRYKLIHTVGAIAKGTFVWNADAAQYTGMFKSAKNILVRLSVAAAPDANSMTPAISVKALRDGMHSANIIGMHTLDGWGPLNWFQDLMCTHIPENPNLPLHLRLLGEKFKLQSDFPGQLGMSEFAAFTEDGKPVSSPKFPWALVFQPNPALKAKMDGNKDLDVGYVLTKLVAGNEILYKIWAPSGPLDTNPTYIGYIQLQSTFLESEFSDLTLFFKHTFIEDDFALRKDWETTFRDPKAKRWETEGYARYTQSIKPWSSTFPN